MRKELEDAIVEMACEIVHLKTRLEELEGRFDELPVVESDEQDPAMQRYSKAFDTITSYDPYGGSEF